MLNFAIENRFYGLEFFSDDISANKGEKSVFNLAKDKEIYISLHVLIENASTSNIYQDNINNLMK